LRERISLAVSEANQCNYCVSAHSFLGSKAGLSESALLDARHGTATDEKTNAALVFARRIVEDRGHVNDEDVEEVRRAGYTDGEIAEIVANVALNIFTNYFNQVAGTEVDFPVARSLELV
jgi:AhpD family alkylhydroperoxidase